MLVTLLGIVIFCKLRQYSNAWFPMLVIPLFMITFLILPLVEYHGKSTELFQFVISPVPVNVNIPSSFNVAFIFSPAWYVEVDPCTIVLFISITNTIIPNIIANLRIIFLIIFSPLFLTYFTLLFYFYTFCLLFQ